MTLCIVEHLPIQTFTHLNFMFILLYFILRLLHITATCTWLRLTAVNKEIWWRWWWWWFLFVCMCEL